MPTATLQLPLHKVILEQASQYAQSKNHGCVTLGHLLFILLQHPTTQTARRVKSVLGERGADNLIYSLQQQLDATLRDFPFHPEPTSRFFLSQVGGLYLKLEREKQPLNTLWQACLSAPDLEALLLPYKQALKSCGPLP